MDTRNPAIKRLTKELQEVLRDASPDFVAYPLPDNLFEWHFTVRGPKDTAYEDGIYHGRILFPPEYPFKPPSFIFLTESGRFQVNYKICLTISSYHPEFWQPAWGISTALMAIISMFPVRDAASLGSLVSSDSDARLLAKKSWKYTCPYCRASNEDLWRVRQNFEFQEDLGVKATSSKDGQSQGLYQQALDPQGRAASTGNGLLFALAALCLFFVLFIYLVS